MYYLHNCIAWLNGDRVRVSTWMSHSFEFELIASSVQKITSEDLKKQTDDVEAKMQQMKEKQLRSVELNALRTSGRASRKSETKTKKNEDEDEGVENEEQNESEVDAERGEVLAALEREKVIEAKKRSEDVAKDGKHYIKTI